jgi:hypothetical protein
MNIEPIKLRSSLTDDLGNDLLSDVYSNNLMEEITSKLVNDIWNKRLEVISERLKEICNIDLNIKEESERRFKRLSIEYKGNEEIIYFNDGTADGKRIVTFVRKELPFEFENHKCEMRVNYSYY